MWMIISLVHLDALLSGFLGIFVIATCGLRSKLLQLLLVMLQFPLSECACTMVDFLGSSLRCLYSK